MLPIDKELLAEAQEHPERLVTVSSRRRLTVCPWQFRATYSDLHVETSDASIEAGSKYHAMLESFYSGKEYADNNDLLRAWVSEWEELEPLAVEQPFLIKRGTLLIGGVIDLVAQDRGGYLWVLDHKISTGQFVSAIPPMMAREQLGIYTLGAASLGFADLRGGILSKTRLSVDVQGQYAFNLATSEGAADYVRWPSWGYKVKGNGRIISGLLHDADQTLRIEREYYEITPEEAHRIAEELATVWGTLYGKDFRIFGAHCNYCPYQGECLRALESGAPAPEIDPKRLHPELMRRLAT